MNALTILQGDSLEKLRELPDESVHCCVTSPPYWGLRNYGVSGQIGLEPTPEEYVAKMVAVFREVRRVLRSDGTCWVNLGDSYYNYRTGYNGALNKQSFHKGPNGKPVDHAQGCARRSTKQQDLKEKDLCGIPWRVAFALQADGWYLRQDIVWHKPNPMPESVRDRCTKAHEYLFMLAKSQRYYYDADAIAEPSVMKSQRRLTKREDHPKGDEGRSPHVRPEGGTSYETRNRRSVWSIPTRAYSEAHFATFPPTLVEPCILAGCQVGGVVLDPFAGSGTVGEVALNNARFAVLIELNPDYISLIHKRCCVEPLDSQPQALPLAAQQLTTPQRT